jgi:hypothetical protein
LWVCVGCGNFLHCPQIVAKLIMKMKELPPIEVLRERLDYNHETGEFKWKVATSNRIKVGSSAGLPGQNGYGRLRIDGQGYQAHRIAWKLYYGEDPTEGYEIDHKNGNRGDNRIDNLRLVLRPENNYNVPLRVNNTSGFRGVSFDKVINKWRAYVMSNHVKINLGCHTSKEDAIAARLNYERENNIFVRG